MSRIKVGISRLNVMDLIEKAQHVVSQMTDNPNFETPVPALTVISTAITDLSMANEAALTGLHQAIGVRNEKYEILSNHLRTLASYIQATSNGVGTVITSSGFELVKPRTPSVLPDEVADLKAITSGYPGCAELKWLSLKEKADKYIIYATQTDPTSATAQWEIVGFSSKAAFVVESLPNHNQYYWFSVVATNSKGVSPMSNPAKCMVL